MRHQEEQAQQRREPAAEQAGGRATPGAASQPQKQALCEGLYQSAALLSK